MTYDDWLEQPYIDAGKRDAAIEAEMERILDEDDYNPCCAPTFYRAIWEGALDGKEPDVQIALDDPEPDFAKLGRVLYNAVYDFCLREAEDEAARRYNDGLGGGDE